MGTGWRQACIWLLWAALTAPAWAAPPRRLDLRAPDRPGAGILAASSDRYRALDALTSSRRLVPGGDAELVGGHPLDARLQTLGDVPAVQTMSRAEEFARRFHREGLPLARLFERRSVLVSLGLNPRGKPGLWLIQKVP